MPEIRRLPSLVVNQIAAGEVVERPASIVKELMENAVDSGATRIDVELEKGGANLVRLVDNGHGIAADQLPLAVTNHATSKISTAEELFEVGSLGFRGEALASIAAVSRLTIRSRVKDADGAELSVHGGAEQDIAPAGRQPGTTVEVRDLFYNTPVRQKFLRTPQTEAGHATEAFTRVALAHPEVHFTLSNNGRVLHDLPAVSAEVAIAGWLSRIEKLFGEELAKALIPVESIDPLEDGSEVRLEGYVAAPTESRSHTKLQYLLLNGRAIRDRSLQHALGEAYRGLLLTGRRPICFLRMTMPPRLVDVNVHPMKLEVRFAEGGSLYSQLLGAIRTKFLSTDLRAGVPVADTGADESTHATEQENGSLVSWAKQELTQRRLDQAQDPRPFKPFPESGSPLSLRPFVRQSQDAATEVVSRGPVSSGQVPNPALAEPAQHEHDPTQPVPSSVESTEATRPNLDKPIKAIQLHNRYLVVETEVGMEVIDQHALHERVLYEQLRARVLSGPLEKQKLLVPEPVDLAPAEAAAVFEQEELLAQLGIDIQPFGGDTVLVGSIPALLGRLSPANILQEIAVNLVRDSKPEARDLCDDLLHTMSCKAAVKYGDPLTSQEIDALIASRESAENHHHCPHGRPTSLVFTREELDRKFKRI